MKGKLKEKGTDEMSLGLEKKGFVIMDDIFLEGSDDRYAERQFFPNHGIQIHNVLTS